MNSAGTVGKISETLWEHHRPTIERLYLKENKRLNAIDAYMRKHHAFIASKSQYEKHFKKWQWRKNLTAPEWRAIIRYIKESAISIDEVDVYFHSNVLSKERIERERLRYGKLTISQAASRLPEGVEMLRQISRQNGHNALMARFPAHSSKPAGLASGFSKHLTIRGSFNTNCLPKIGMSCSWYPMPFSWASSVNWDILSQPLSHSQLVTKQRYHPSQSWLDATFNGPNRTLSMISETEGPEVLLLAVITSLLNNMNMDRDTTSNNAYKILRLLPQSALMQILKALPPRILDTLAERALAAAILADDGALVSAMLSLGASPHEYIKMDQLSQSELGHPLEFAVCQRLYSAAEALLKSMCQNATQEEANEFFGYIFTKKVRKHRPGLEEPEMIELICPILAAGARPVKNCFSKNYWGSSPLTTIQRLFYASSVNIAEWLQLGLLEEFLSFYQEDRDADYRETAAKDVLQHIFLERVRSDPLGHPNLEQTLLHALKIAMKHFRYWVFELILPVMWDFHHSLDDNVARTFVADKSFQNACSNGQWTLGAFIMLAQHDPAVLASARHRPPKRSKEEILEVSIKSIEEHISRNDLGAVHMSLADDMLWKKDESHPKRLITALCDRVDQALCLGWPLIAICIIQAIVIRGYDGLAAILVLFSRSETMIVTSLLRMDSTWCRALETATKYKDFGMLETLIYQRPSQVPYVARGPDATFLFPVESVRRQMHLRLIAFHAIEADNKDLCAWLFELGMDASELIHHQDTECSADFLNDFVTHRPHTPAAGAFTTAREREPYTDDHILPSLVAVVAEQNRTSWFSFLFAKVGHARDSMALFRAVKIRAESATILCLMTAANVQKHSSGMVYGSAALRQAIRYQDLDLVAELCEVVDIDAIERTTEEFLEEKDAFSPMGEAIAMNDPDLVSALLKHGADPNTCVAHKSRQWGNVESILPRMTPLLAAIDMQSLFIVQLLVDAGAELHHNRALGIFRTPLQRAAEVGNLEILRYLLSKGASIDTTPKYSSATELQLAAMSGFVGVATYLLELGAKVNHPPAEGEGRTAFEAAAENGRIDMMLLLIQSGVQLHLEFGNPPESQFVRAKRFTEKNGFPAAKRIVESLLTTPITPTEELLAGELRTEDALSLGLWPSPNVRTTGLPGLSP